MAQKNIASYFQPASLSLPQPPEEQEPPSPGTTFEPVNQVATSTTQLQSVELATLAASSDTNCQCSGCIDLSQPYQPLEVSQSKLPLAHNSKERNEGQLKLYSRKIQPSWYKKYPYCSSSFRIFCVHCRRAKEKKLLTLSKYQKVAFVSDGFGNWSKALQRFREHERSEMHQEAISKLTAMSCGINVAVKKVKKTYNFFVEASFLHYLLYLIPTLFLYYFTISTLLSIL